jgi:hypothetical protein
VSIGIVAATADAVLLVADGRQSDAQNVLTDQAQKVVEINERLAIIEIGVLMSSNAVTAKLKGVVGVQTGDEYIILIRDIVREEGLSLFPRIAPGTGDMTRLKVGLLAGGIDDQGPFIGGAVFGHDMQDPHVQFYRPQPGSGQFVCLGGEVANAGGYFGSLAARAFKLASSDANGLIVMLQRAARKTVQHAARADRSIGGRIQYRVLTRRAPARAGFL